MAPIEQRGYAHPEALVSTDWVEQHLKDPNLTVLFIGDDNEYKKTHIPGAQNVQMEDFAIEDNSPTGYDS